MDQFQVILQAVFEKAGIHKSLQDVQTLAKQLPIEMTTKLNTASTRNDFKVFAKEIANDLNKSMNLNLSAKDIMSAYDQMVKSAQKASDVQIKAEKNKQNEIKKTANRITEQANVIRKAQEVGSIKTKTDSVASSYAKYEKLGLVTEQLKTDFEQLNIAQTALGNSTTDEELVSNYNNFNLVLNKVNNTLKQTKINTASVTSTISDVARLSKINTIQTYMDNNSKATKKFGSELYPIIERLKQLDVPIDKIEFNKLEAEFKRIQTAARETGNIGATAFDKLKKAWEKLGGWTLAATSLTKLVGVIKDVKNNVIELDTAITNLQMATGGSYNQTADLMNSYIDLGKEMSASAIDVANAANDYLRQGKTIKETNELVKDSLVLSKIGAIEASQATEYLTTAMKGYKVEAENAIGIVDKLSAVDMASATSAGGLAEGMAQVANNANIAGVSMEKLLGYLAVVGETSGEGMSSVGNSFSTMFSRMGNIKLARLDDYQNSGEDLNNVETVLSNLGIKLRDDTDTFRNFGDVLDEVAGNWSSYSDVNQRAIASAIAGKNQMEEFLILMSSYGKATEYATVATESSGTAMDKYSDYEESIKGRTEELTVAFQSFSNTVLDSDLIKWFLDFGTAGISALDGINKAITPLGTTALLGGGAGVIAFIKNLD